MSTDGEMRLSWRYEAIADECLSLAATWREKIRSLDNEFRVDQHRRAVLRAAAYSRLADRQRAIEAAEARRELAG